MKLPLMFNSGVDTPTQATNVTNNYVQNWYVAKYDNGKQKEILQPLPSKTIASTSLSAAPNSGTGCKGAISVDYVLNSIYGDTYYKDATVHKKPLFSAVPSHVDMAENGNDMTDSYVLMTANLTSPEAYVANPKYNYAAWALDGTTTYNVSGTSDAHGGAADRLYESTGTPFSVGTATTSGTIELGMTVHNITTDTWAQIIAVVDANTLQLSSPIFNVAGGESYEIAASYNTQGVGVTSAGNPPFTQPYTCTYLDGYFIVDDQAPSTRGRFYISAQNNACRWNSLDFANAVSDPDKIVAVRAVGKELWLVGKTTTEIWTNTGDSDFPFAPIQGATIQKGTKYPYTVQTIDNKILWLASSKLGGREVVMSDGHNVITVSTPSIETYLSDITGSTTIVKPFAFTFNNKSNAFYCLTYESAGIDQGSYTLCYNITTDRWSVWNTGSSNGSFFQGRALLNHSSVDVVYTLMNMEANNYQVLAGNNTTAYNNYILSNGNNYEYIYTTNVLHSDGAQITYRAIEVDVDGASMFPQITADAGGGTYTTDIVDAVHYTGVDGSDQVQNLTTGAAAVTCTTFAGQNITPASGTWNVGDVFRILDSTGTQKFPASGIKLRYRDKGKQWSDYEDRVPAALNTKYIFRNLGKSSHRDIEIKVDESIDPIIIGMYAIIDVSDREVDGR